MSSPVLKDYPENRFMFSDMVDIEAPRAEVYRMLWDVEHWPDLLPHVNRITMLEDGDSEHRFRMEVKGPDGIHVTESVRQGELDASISYEQLRTPPLLSEHRGRWTLENGPRGLRVISEHTIQVIPENIVQAFGRAYTVQEAALLARHLIGNHSLSTLRIVKERAEKQCQPTAGE